MRIKMGKYGLKKGFLFFQARFFDSNELLLGKISCKALCSFLLSWLFFISCCSFAEDVKKNNELKLNGSSPVAYDLEGKDKINPFGGEMSADIRFDFDPRAKNQENKTILRNQNFITFKVNDEPGKNLASLYSCLDNICFSIRNANGKMIAYAGGRYAFEGDKWYNIKLRWGQIFKIYVNGNEVASSQIDGLAAQLLPGIVKVFIGALDAKSKGIENRFSIRNIRFTSPGNEKLSCVPKTAFSLIENEKPVLDGKIDDAFWKKCGKAAGFVKFSKFELAAEQPYILAGYTNDGIYLGMETPVQGDAINATLKERDSGVYSEDALEIRFEPAQGKIYTFILSAIGTKYDAVTNSDGITDLRYNPEWEVKTSSGDGKWTAEVFIPFKSLGSSAVPASGTNWRGNFCIDSSSGYNYSTSWAFTNGNFCDKNYFGEFIFSGGPRALRLENVKGFMDGLPECNFHLCGPFPPVITLNCKTYDSAGLPVSEYVFPLRDGDSAIYKTDFLSPGTHKIFLSGIDDEKKEWFRQEFYFIPKINLTLDVSNYPYAGFTNSKISAGKYANTAVTAKVCIAGKNGRDLGLRKEAVFKKGKTECDIETKNLEPGTYCVKAEVFDSKGKLLDKVEKTMEIYPKPSWWMNNLGIDHTVPPPWTAVRKISSGLGVWGRDYILNKGLFPVQIINQRKDMFAGRASLKLNGSDIFAIKAAGEKKYDDEIILNGSDRIQRFNVNCQGKLEFDGFFRYDFSVQPEKSNKIESLVLEIPLKKELAQYLHMSNGGSGSVQQIKNDIAMGFMPNMWIGNYDMGIAFVFESDQFWRPVKSKNKIELLKMKDDNFCLRFNIVTSPFVLKEKMTISLAMLPTPVKDVRHDPFRYAKWNASAAWQKTDPLIERAENLVYRKPKGFNGKEGAVEFWVKRIKDAGKDSSEVFNMLNKRKKLTLEIDKSKNIHLAINGKDLFKKAIRVNMEDNFSFLGLYWKNSEILLYLNGKKMATAKLDGEAQDWKTIMESPETFLVFGCADISGEKGCSDIIIDDIKISSTVPSDYSMPQTPFQNGKEILLGDHLDDSFRPDGSDAETTAGGIPSIGTSFVSGKFGNGLKVNTEKPMRTTVARKEAGNTFEFNEGWHKDAKIVGLYPPNILGPLEDGVQDVIKTAHNNNWRALPYFVISMLGVGSQVEKQFVSEWCVKPMNIVPFSPPQGHYIVYVSPAARGYADYLAAGVRHVMNDCHFDGIYTDGFCHVDPTSNPAYGAGYLGEDGKMHATWPFFACRETSKRLYKIVKKLNPEKGFVVNHTSFSTEITSLSFSDLYYTGEHEDYENLDTAKIRFRGEPWGLETRILGSSSHTWSPLHKMIAMLHGTDVWGYGITGRKDMCRKYVNIRNAYEKADFRTAEWVPYFKGEGIYYKETDKDIKVSMYLHKGRDAFLIIGNLGAETKTVSIPLVLKALGLASKKIKACNALTDVPMNISSDGMLEAKIKGKSFILVNLSLE